MRSALEEVATVSEIETDTSTTTCSFKVNLDEVDIQGTLNELAKTNDHIDGWSLKSQKSI